MRKLLYITLCTVFAISLQAQHEIFKDLDAGETTSVYAYIDADSDLDAKYKDYTLLNKSIEEGHTQVALRLVASGADVNIMTKGKSPLVYAALLGDKELVEKLLAAGARIDRAYIGDNTVAQVAANEGNHEAAAVLLRAWRDYLGQ